MATKTLMTAEELHTLPGGGERYELVNGEPREMPVPNPDHSYVGSHATRDLTIFVEQHELGVALVTPSFRLRRNPDQTRIPDVAFLRREVWETLNRRAAVIDGVPDLAVEIVSPSDTYGSVREKALEWLEAGARMVWVVDPLSRTVEVYSPGQESVTRTVADTLDGADVLPGFSLPVRALFV